MKNAHFGFPLLIGGFDRWTIIKYVKEMYHILY